MSVVYIGQSQAKEDQIERFRTFMETRVIPAVQAEEACESIRMFQGIEDPTKFTVIEVWESIEAHQASIANIRREDIEEFMKLVAERPTGGHYVERTSA